MNKPYDMPPTRLSMVLDGYGTLALLPNKGIFCSNMPVKGREDLLCPFLTIGNNSLCHEYNKQKNKEEKNKDKKIFVKFPNKKVREYIQKEWRVATARKYKYTCVYCHRHNNQRDADGKKIRIVIDHFYPLALGGTNTVENLVCSCWDCNASKGANLWEVNCRIGYYKGSNNGIKQCSN
jgi:hypothetical protein